MMRYQPQGLKPYFVRTPIKNLMAITATTKATTFPTKKLSVFSELLKIIS